MKKIWVINQYQSAAKYGLAGRSYYFAKYLAKLNYRVKLITASYTHLSKNNVKNLSESVKVEEIENFELVQLRVPRYKEAHSKKRIFNWFYFSFILSKVDKLFQDKPDVIVYSSPSLVGFLGAHRLAKKYQCKLIFDVRDIWPLTLLELGNFSKYHPFIQFLSWVEKRAYGQSDHVISNLKYAKNHMLSHGLRDPKKFSWIPNGIDWEEIQDSDDLNFSTRENIPTDKFLVGYTGTFGLANNLQNLLQAAAIVQNKNGEIHFVLIGSGREKDQLNKLIDDLSIKNVTILDAIPKKQIFSVLDLFDALFVGAAKSDLYKFGVSPNKLFEYMYAGKPIIYSIESGDFHPIAEIDAGVEVAADDPAALAHAVISIYELNEEDRKRMGSNAHNAAMSHYNYKSLTDSLSELF